jgi:chromosome segregation ATPase
MYKKPLTRRAREYCEVLDKLRDEGYLTYEEWEAVSPKIQEEKTRLTSRQLEDEMMAAGYSKGSPQEQKKYRQLWLKERGILEGNELQMGHVTSDPILSAVETFKKRLEKDANERAENAIQAAQIKVKKADEKHKILEEEYYGLNQERDSLQNELSKLKRTQAYLEKTHGTLEKNYESLEKQLKEDNKNYKEHKEKEQKHHKEMMDEKDKTINQLRVDLQKTKQEAKQDISDIKESAEKQRHQFIVDIQVLRDENNKLQKQTHKLELNLQKMTTQAQIKEQQRKQLQQSYETLSKEYKVKSKESLEKDKKLSALQVANRMLEETKTQYKNDLEKAQKNHADAKEKIGYLLNDLEDKKRQLYNIEQQLKKHEQKIKN